MVDDQGILRLLSEHNIAFVLHSHDPIFGVKDMETITLVKKTIKGVHVKNLFMKSDRGFFLFVVPDEGRIDLKSLKKTLGLKDFSFADAASMMRLLGVTPGSVTPLGIINDINHEITIYIDRAVMASTIINVHPLRNDQTVSLNNNDIEKFLHISGHTLHVIDVPKIST